MFQYPLRLWFEPFSLGRKIHVMDAAERPILHIKQKAPLGTVAALHPLDARDDAVAVHGLVEVGALDEDVALDVVERAERVTARKRALIRMEDAMTKRADEGRPNALPLPKKFSS